jgi:hypothetical protein
MSERVAIPFSERCRILAQECRVRAQSYWNEKTRAQMLLLAEDYERKAVQAEQLEATLQAPREDSPSLIPEIAEAFVNRLKALSPSPPIPDR